MIDPVHRIMNADSTQKKTAGWLLLALACSTVHATEQAWPKLLNGNGLPECQATLRLARQAYHSNRVHLWEPQTIPQEFDDRLVLGPDGVDLSGGDALNANADVFAKIPLPAYAPRSIYWQKQTDLSDRLVVEEVPHGWRGDAYNVMLLPGEITPSDYFSADQPRRTTQFKTLFSGAWRAPLVFQKKHALSLWVVYVGEPYDFSPNWRIYLPRNGQLQKTCEIQFRPDVKHATSLLPAPAQKLAIMLDQSIGSGADEGTLQPTARIRINVAQAWANAALRPWALTDPYNTRQEVDAGLTAWSQQGVPYAAAYRHILRQYPLAERSLANYYRNRFKRKPAEAKRFAAYAMDIVFRSHYVFHSEDPEKYSRYDHPAPNPWRQSVVN
ncbi:hypothetical protein SNK19_16945 [Ralstonia pseudosolanacearum]|uniref:hypothetical protein n=2 Tax=Ralstonia pseudosolanacearum TaxID=1310165 RepID=UPI003CED2979